MTCIGCGSSLPPKKYQGNPRKWCGESCRMRHQRPARGPQPRNCLQCNGSFIPNSGGQRWCSKSCREADHARTCQVCKETFVPTAGSSGRFCSRRCANKATSAGRAQRKTRVVPECEVCGAPFTKSYSQQRTCGRMCGRVLQASNRALLPPRAPKPKLKPEKVLQARVCGTCQATFYGLGISCSDPCRKARLAVKARERAALKVKPVREYGLECFTCGQGFTSPYKTTRHCSNRCRKHGKRDWIDRAKRHGVYYERFSPLSVYERDGWKCGICGDLIDRAARWPDQMCVSLDHIMPLSLGGSHTPENSRPAHWLCNALRGASDIDFMVTAA